MRLSDATLADRIGDLDAQRDALAEEIDELKDEFTRRGLKLAEGKRFDVTRDVEPVTRFDAKGAKEFLGAKAAEFEKAATRTVWRIRKASPRGSA
ncbi:MAG: hypothetical protein KGK02_11445 [Rhodospirillales bacterium]|nr:hypothetical protein [Rhodospirillales bacterium]